MFHHHEQGIIHELSEDSLYISFEIPDKDVCETCGLKVVCSPGSDQSRVMRFPLQKGFSVGDRVQLIETRNLELHLAMLQFGLPIISFLVGLLLGFVYPQSLIRPELNAFFGGLVGLGLSFTIGRKAISRLSSAVPHKYLQLKHLS